MSNKRLDGPSVGILSSRASASNNVGPVKMVAWAVGIVLVYAVRGVQRVN